MKIGSNFPIINNPGRQPGQPLSPEQNSQPQADSGKKSQSSAAPLSLDDFIAAAEQSSAARESTFFNQDRPLSARGREALSAYLTTEAFQTQSQGELVGVDLYI